MSTLIPPRPANPNRSPIESVLELTHLSAISPDLFTNTRPLWHPPGARGIYGGAVIAQCLAAAQRTVPTTFTVHSMHCYFVLAGDSGIPVIYHVEQVRSGRSFATRTVQARQRGAVIFTVTMSFVREGSGGRDKVEHATRMAQVPGPHEVDEDEVADGVMGGSSPFESQRVDILNNDSDRAEEKRTRQWIRAKGRISDEGGYQAHLSALAYMSDSYFIGTVARVHKLWRYSGGGKGDKAFIDESVVKRLRDMDVETLKRVQGMDDDVIEQIKNGGEIKRPQVGMMVSLDHTIYFHEPRAFRADEWMFTEMETPWAGDGRGVVFQKIYTREGKLIATCVQEGVVRLRQEEQAKL